MIVQITRAKVGHRQAPFKQKPSRNAGFCKIEVPVQHSLREPVVAKSIHVGRAFKLKKQAAAVSG